jgi:hypothetical protein
MAEPDDLLARLAATLDDDPAYERHGEPVSDPWGAFQWFKHTDARGEEDYLRIVIERYQPPG